MTPSLSCAILSPTAPSCVSSSNDWAFRNAPAVVKLATQAFLPPLIRSWYWQSYLSCEVMVLMFLIFEISYYKVIGISTTCPLRFIIVKCLLLLSSMMRSKTRSWPINTKFCTSRHEVRLRPPKHLVSGDCLIAIQRSSVGLSFSLKIILRESGRDSYWKTFASSLNPNIL